MIKQTLLIGFFIALISNPIFSQNKKYVDFKFPDRIGFVNDFDKIFTNDQIKELDEIIRQHEKETSNEIAIVTIDSIKPYQNLFDYSLDLANEWGVGKKNKNNGITIVFGKRIREIQIQVGYGLEKKLKDEEAKRIIDSTIIPEFKKGDFYLGIKNGLIEIIKEIK
jgi:uncharacterized protein